MIKKTISLFCLLLIAGALALLTLPAEASPPRQVFDVTPTAGTDGRILYIVKPGDSCLSISLRFLNGDVNTLRQLNNLGEDCLLLEGQELLLGVVEEPTATPGPTPTATSILPTPTPFEGNGTICVFLYHDINGNALAEDNEASIPGGAVSISDRTGEVSMTGTTVFGLDPYCFEDLPEGDYNISVAVPDGYNSTTVTSYSLSLRAGERSTIDFGAQLSSVAAQPAASGSRASPLLGVLGGLLLLAGVGLGVYFWRLRR